MRGDFDGGEGVGPKSHGQDLAASLGAPTSQHGPISTGPHGGPTSPGGPLLQFRSSCELFVQVRTYFFTSRSFLVLNVEIPKYTGLGKWAVCDAELVDPTVRRILEKRLCGCM